ncbi:MAG: hypothetical protein Solivirus1_1 [Solivirus sp.]|uniref:Uncharacterized protein n=1 Tax=Solivirus sp. TaxID=2487772 RepID=A0A3G5AGX4_9VIRU|nr:MAG: hypothetical protein Solivirus1_1 [Solivirus sp.]
MTFKGKISEKQLVQDFIEHYKTCSGKPTIMKYLDRKEFS